MSARNTVTFYLHPQLRRRAESGNHNFINLLSEVLVSSGQAIAFDDDTKAARLRAATRPGHSLFLMQEPVNARGLTIRKTYIYPFWHIEKQAARWDWPVAEAGFDAQSVDPALAANFYRAWRRRLFENAAFDISSDGTVYVPLQGKLLRQRSFQTCSPIDMLKTVLSHEPLRRIVATLHPGEVYSPQERKALDDLTETDNRLEVQVGGMERHLQSCDYVVTQNSGAGFMGYFFGKPLILFAKSDFHHIALNVTDIGKAEAFARVMDHRPDYAAYLHWFLQERAINAGRPEAHQRIRDTLRLHGWPV